jgi:hypothetical protein
LPWIFVPTSEILAASPAITADVDRLLPLLDAAVNVTLPDPVPPWPTTSHEALLAAFHVHPAAVVTFTCAEPPDAGNFSTVGEMA